MWFKYVLYKISYFTKSRFSLSEDACYYLFTSIVANVKWVVFSILLPDIVPQNTEMAALVKFTEIQYQYAKILLFFNVASLSL